MSKKRNQNRRKRRFQSDTLGFENLEDRQLLAFDFLFDGITLTLNQTADDGVVQIDNSGPSGEFQVNDGAGFVAYEAASNVVVNLLDNSTHLTVALNDAHSGDLTINAGNGNRSILFASPGTDIGGDLEITAGNGEQTLSLSHISMLQVGGSINIDTGADLDALNFLNSIQTAGNLRLDNANQIHVGDDINVGGNLNINNLDLQSGQFEKLNAAPSEIAGDFIYSGGNQIDRVQLQDIIIGGDVNVDFSRGITIGAETQSLFLDNVEFNNLSLQSTDSTNPDINSWNNVVAQGNVVIDMGEGINSSFMHGTINGGSLSYVGLDGADIVGYDMAGGTGQSLSFALGAGMDNFTLFNGATVDDLHVDFGGADDIFNNGVGDFTFDTQLINLDGFDIEYKLASDTLTVNQRADSVAVFLELHSDPFSERFSFDTNELTSATNLNVSMSDNNLGSFDLYLEHAIGGDLNVDLGHGPRQVDFQGAFNAVAGNFQLQAGDGEQFFYPDTISGLVVGGTASIDLGQGNDYLEVSNALIAGGSIDLVNVNQLELLGGLGAIADVNIDTSSDSAGLFFNAQDDLEVRGNFNIQGSDQFAEQLNLQTTGASKIEGHVYADLGSNTSAVGSQYIIVNSTMRIESGVTMLSTNDSSTDFFRSNLNSEIGGDILIDLGDGVNIGNFGHEVLGGELLKFVSGIDNDEVFLRTSGLPMNYNIELGAGKDGLTLEATVNISDMLRIDFGGGEDAFTNNKGAYTWDTRLLNFYGFNNFYDPSTDSLRVVQVENTVNVALDNDGFANSIQVDVFGGGSYELTPVTNLQVEMLANSSTNIALDLNTSINGDVILNLSHGDRELHFVGTNNSIGGDLRIVAGDGNQDAFLATNQDLTVYGETVINLRNGVDSIIDDGNQLHFDTDLFLRNIDNFEVKNSLFVGGNMNMVSHWYTQDVSFDNDGSIQIDGDFTFLGSDGADDLRLGGNTMIGGDVFIRLGESVSPGMGQAVDISNGFEAMKRFTLKAGTSMAGNAFSSDATTFIGRDMIVDFTDSMTSNTALINGNFGGNYGTFRGGSAADNLQFDAVAEDMEWVSLMHGGSDEVALGTSTNVLSKYIDFAIGDDLFEDGHLEEFPLWTVNLP